MTNLTDSQRARYVRAIFSRIAPRYDLMNRLMTAGQDVHWRREVIWRAALPPNGRLLDLGAGTGDLACEARRQYPHSQAVAADFTLEMMLTGKQRLTASPRLTVTPSPEWSAADALHLPFPGETFDAVVSGFLLRNLANLPRALCEQYRVLATGGRFVALDTTRPPQSWLSPAINLHLHTIIPTLGRLLTGDREAYLYLPDSTENFLTAEQLATRLLSAGFRQVGFRRLMFGTVAIHWAVK